MTHGGNDPRQMYRDFRQNRATDRLAVDDPGYSPDLSASRVSRAVPRRHENCYNANIAATAAHFCADLLFSVLISTLGCLHRSFGSLRAICKTRDFCRGFDVSRGRRLPPVDFRKRNLGTRGALESGPRCCARQPRVALLVDTPHARGSSRREGRVSRISGNQCVVRVDQLQRIHSLFNSISRFVLQCIKKLVIREKILINT